MTDQRGGETAGAGDPAGEPRSGIGWWLSLVALPLLVKAPLLLGVLNGDPVLSYGEIAGGPIRSTAWTPTIDPNIAFTSHALGSLASRLLLRGQPLWWNPYEGVGAPLAGEMQSAALFPPTWLMLLHQGQLLEHLLFQIVAGCATFALLRRLGLVPLAAWVGGAAFAFNGTFAWMANAVVNPICFLPVMLLGVELLRGAAGSSAAGGGALLALGVAGSLYAGFPEVAYLHALLVAVWTLARAVTRRPGGAGAALFLARVGLFATGGLLVAAPILLPFLDYLQDAYVGIHAAGLAGRGLSGLYAAAMPIPYLPGTLFQGDPYFWGNVGGYTGLLLPSLAVAGCLGRRDRALRLVLAGWIAVAVATMFGMAPVTIIVGLIPGMKQVAAYRYLPASVSLALAVLAGYAIDDLIRGRADGGVLRRATSVVLAVTMIVAGVAIANGIFPLRPVARIPLLAQLAVVVAFWLAVRRDPAGLPRPRAGTLAALAVAEAVLLFVVPMLAYPNAGRPMLGGVGFLREHLGVQRFVTLGPIAANYGSRFGIAQVNHNDLPVPRSWVGYLHRHLDPQGDPINFSPTSVPALLAHLPGYAAIGTRYVVTPPARRFRGRRSMPTLRCGSGASTARAPMSPRRAARWQSPVAC